MAIVVATTWTTDSSASEKIAAECVRKYALVFITSIPPPMLNEMNAARFLRGMKEFEVKIR